MDSFAIDADHEHDYDKDNVCKLIENHELICEIAIITF